MCKKVMHHKTGTTPFDINLSDVPTIEASKFLQEAGEDVYLLFVQMQEALMEPYGTDAATYMQLLPTAAALTQAAVSLAASGKDLSD